MAFAQGMGGAGTTVEQIVENVAMDDFSDYENYGPWLRANVISMWDYLYRYREPIRARPDRRDISKTGRSGFRSEP